MDHDKKINTLKDLENLLRCDEAFLTQAINTDYSVSDINDASSYPKLDGNIYVSRLYIKKKGKAGGFRVVYSARSFQLDNTLKVLNNYFNRIFTPSVCVHGFVKNRNISSNAAKHLSKKYILSVDIKDFFESISTETIKEQLINIGFNENAALWISKITTLNNSLAQGFNTSPVIANIVSKLLDEQLINYCGDKIEYTRYADDLYFSSNEIKPSVSEITKIIQDYGFKLNDEKTKLMIRGRNQYVTGLTVFDSNYPRVSKKIKRNIRLEIYFLQKFGYKKHIQRKLRNRGIKPDSLEYKLLVGKEISKTRDRLYGWLHYINSIEPKFSEKYYQKLNKVKN